MGTILWILEILKQLILTKLLLNFLDKINLKRSDTHIVLSNLSIYIHGKIQKSHTKIINLKYQLEHGIKHLNYLKDHIVYQIFKISLNIHLKNMGKD